MGRWNYYHAVKLDSAFLPSPEKNKTKKQINKQKKKKRSFDFSVPTIWNWWCYIVRGSNPTSGISWKVEWANKQTNNQKQEYVRNASSFYSFIRPDFFYFHHKILCIVNTFSHLCEQDHISVSRYFSNQQIKCVLERSFTDVHACRWSYGQERKLLARWHLSSFLENWSRSLGSLIFYIFLHYLVEFITISSPTYLNLNLKHLFLQVLGEKYMG